MPPVSLEAVHGPGGSEVCGLSGAGDSSTGLGSANRDDSDRRITTMDDTWIFGVFLGAFFVVGFAAGLTWRQGACGDVNARGGAGDRRGLGQSRGRRRDYHSPTTPTGTTGRRRSRWEASDESFDV